MKKKRFIRKKFWNAKRTMFREYSQPEHIRKTMNYCPQEVIMVSILSSSQLPLKRVTLLSRFLKEKLRDTTPTILPPLSPALSMINLVLTYSLFLWNKQINFINVTFFSCRVGLIANRRTINGKNLNYNDWLIYL